MKRNTHLQSIVYMLTFSTILFAYASCKKDDSVSSTVASGTTSTSTQAIAVSANRSAAGDSIYVVGTCDRGHHTDSIAFSNLPAGIPTYLTANYAGYAFQKAYTDKDTLGNVAGYVVIINYNGNPIGL